MKTEFKGEVSDFIRLDVIFIRYPKISDFRILALFEGVPCLVEDPDTNRGNPPVSAGCVKAKIFS